METPPSLTTGPVVASQSSGLGKVGLATAIGIVIANIVGTGVFTSLGFQLPEIHSDFAVIMLWIVGGIVALCGALCYGELAAAMPRSGGEYHFLSKIYHPALGFMAGLISATVGFAAPIAVAAMAFGKYLHGVGVAGSPLLFSFAIVWIVTAFHFSKLETGSLFQNLWTIVKLALTAAVIGAGLLLSSKQDVTFLPQAGDTKAIFSAPFAVALIYVMYSYSGWNAAVYISDEVAAPQRNVPRALLFGTVTVIIAYVLLNAVFLLAAPRAEMSGQLEVALIAGKHIFGPNGGRVLGAIICLGLVATISSMAWLGPRVTATMGEDHHFLSYLGRRNSHGVPVAATGLQFLLVNLMLLTRSFEVIVVYIGFSLLFCTFLTVAGMVLLRFTQPDLPRPYRVWAYPIPPLLFIGVTGWMMIYLLRERPTESLSGVITMCLGLALYYLAGKRPATAT